MTIGSSYNYPAQRAAQLARSNKLHKAGPWSGRYPNPPDLNFDYRSLVRQVGGVASATSPNHRICIIGAGMTGLTAARELYRSGFNNVTLFEARDRIAGRHYTITNVGGQGPQQTTYSPFEMAAMRMPYFNTTDETPNEGMSLLAHYAQEFGLSTQDFPNPGTPWVTSTGIYLQEGLVQDGATIPTMQIWVNPDGSTPPPTPEFQAVYAKWKKFETMMVDKVSEVYGTEGWEPMWQAIVNTYSPTAFRDFVSAPAIDAWSPADPGNFGGLGMTSEESNIFYAIGFGDGSWGAFYDVCTIYPLRTAIFGFGAQLQLIHGRYLPNGNFNPGPFANLATVPDTNANPFEGPRYRGVRTFDDCMMFLPVPERGSSLYEHFRARLGGLNTSTTVKRLERTATGINVFYSTLGGPVRSQEFDSVVMTVPSWIMEVDMELQGFSLEEMPRQVTRAYKTAHWETSCKVYAPIDPSFFSQNVIPPILVTDTFVHDVYAYRYGVGGYEVPCILISYTWEDDATKLASFNDTDLVDRCIAELDRILMRSSNIGQTISQYIDKDKARVVRWITEPSSLGCAKLYRAGTYSDAMTLLAYNRDVSPKSGLYLAGESFSVDAGWTEPSLRGAIDAVINICNNTSASFHGGFTMEDYPRYQVGAEMPARRVLKVAKKA